MTHTHMHGIFVLPKKTDGPNPLTPPTFNPKARRFIHLLITLLCAGFLLGALHKHQWVLFTILVTVGTLKVYRKMLLNKTDALCDITGFGLTALLGTSCELWGTYNHYWTYHDIPAYQLIPVWIPVAWGFTYFAFHLFEKCIYQISSRHQINLLAIALTTFILPTVGEYIPIYMGVWTYHWPYQFMGVPLLASLGIWAVHIVVFMMMGRLNQKYQLNNAVYNLLIR